eukprot:4579708-Amphidinium_carterae.1
MTRAFSRISTDSLMLHACHSLPWRQVVGSHWPYASGAQSWNLPHRLHVARVVCGLLDCELPLMGRLLSRSSFGTGRYNGGDDSGAGRGGNDVEDHVASDSVAQTWRHGDMTKEPSRTTP